MTIRYEVACQECDWYGRSNNREWFHTLVLKHLDEHLDSGTAAVGMTFRQRKESA